MIQKFTQDFLILWATIDPIGTLAVFVAVTAGMTATERRRIALKASFYSSVILLASVILGQIILTAMGVRLISLQVAGGIILFLFGLQMVFGKSFKDESAHGEEGHDIAVFPLAVPSIASPGAIMAAIITTDNTVYSIPTQIFTAALMLGVLGATCLGMIYSSTIFKVLGKNGASILIRVMGMLLSALSVELVMKALGISGWMTGSR